jgi:MFS family permease
VANWRLWLPPAVEKRRVRVYVAGHIVSVLGNWFQQVALSWLVYRLTGSVFLLGLTGFLLNIFYLLLGSLAGAASDRLPRMPLLVVVDIILASLAALLAGLVIAGVSDIRAYLVVATLCGIANAFEMPVRQSLFKEIVEDKSLLPGAIAVSAMVFNLGRLAGPAMAGFVLLFVSEAWCFLFNALSYAAIIVALVKMKLPPSAFEAHPGSGRVNFLANLEVVTALPAIKYLLPTVVALGLFATPYVHLMPSIVAAFFDGRSSTVGVLMAAGGSGAFLTASYLAMQPGVYRQLRLLSIAPMVVGAALLVFAFSRSLSLSIICLMLLGGSMMLTSNTTNALLQQSAPEEWRGRVIGLYTMAFAGTAPLGNLLAGWTASKIGLTATLAINGLLIMAAGVVGRQRLQHHPEAMRAMVRQARG